MKQYMGDNGIFLDHNVTTPTDKRVVEAMLPYFTEKFATIHSQHSLGKASAKGVKEAGGHIAKLIGCAHFELTYTSGGTEAANMAMKGLEMEYGDQGFEILTTRGEHQVIRDLCHYLQQLGCEIRYLPTDKGGMILTEAIDDHLNSNTLMVAIGMVNGETGAIQPIETLGEKVRAKNAVVSQGMPHIAAPVLFVDGSQAVGRIPVDVVGQRIDMMSFTAHKFYGPMGVGALYMRTLKPRRVKITQQTHGGMFQRAMRSGNLNVPGIVGMGEGARIARAEMDEENSRLQKLRDTFEDKLTRLPGVSIAVKPEHRVPHLTSIRFEDAPTSTLNGHLKRVQASIYSSFASRTDEGSVVLRRLGFTIKEARETMRFSLGRFTTEQELDEAVKDIEQALLTTRQAETAAHSGA
ncbi:cysteine desulfurase family protein [Roseivirga sp. BDSF3-8]|uniref:cysteine desulfurase family protein n=1 Tax=Roseivirga sp. BDSF3-8 TaxID=3241598 RepID=UPI00353217AB